MSNALLSDVEARAELRRTRTRAQMWQGLVEDAWRRSMAAAASGHPAEALRWLERAHRMLPGDGTVMAALAGALLQAGEAARAAGLFRTLAERDREPAAWTGLAASLRVAGDLDGALAALEAALRCTVPSPTLQALGDVLAAAAGLPGWCALDGEGVLHAGPVRPRLVRLDGADIRPDWAGTAGRLPPGWQAAHGVEVDGYLGSPIPVAAIIAVEGFVESHQGGLRGWAWHPADPLRDPVLAVHGAGGLHRLTASAPADDVRLSRPLGRPRAFQVSAEQLGRQPGLVSVRGRDGRHLLGSPLDPGLDRRSAAALALGVRDGGASMPAWADAGGACARPAARPAPVDVVVPVHRGLATTLACLDSVLATVPRGTRIVVVEDASPEPALVAALLDLQRRRRIRLIRQAENRGFPASANAGLRACAGRDVVLLNSDTLVPPGWLQRLRAAAYAAPDIGTATPWSNDATILSYPDADGGNPIPDAAAVARLDTLAQQVNGAAVAGIPTGVGFCLYARRDCLDQVGLLREDCFAQGYGEENDFCMRAGHLGWRSVAALGVFVGHVGSQSFGSARAHLAARNIGVLNRLHPGYDAVVAAHVAADPLGPARRRMDEARWAEQRCRAGAVVLVTHAGGGGVDRVVAGRAAHWASQGRRAVVLRPAPGGCRVDAAGLPNLAYRLPGELPALAQLLRGDRVRAMEVHHLLGHRHAVLGLARLLRTPVHSFIHDYALFCPRIALVSTNRRYCGEPDVAGCEACIADLGSNLEEDLPVRALVARSAADLAAAAQVVVPSQDVAARIRRHFPGLQPVVQPWEDDLALPPVEPAQAGPVRRVCVVGAIGVEKGFEVLLACARDARARRLPLEFVVVGYTSDDERLMEAGPVFVTGEFQESDAVALIRAQGAQLAFIPSVWPETWCYALSRAWEAGLMAAAFDLGAPAERIRATGRGWLLPLALHAAGVNDALLQAPLPARSAPAAAACAGLQPVAMVPASTARGRAAKRT